MSYDDVDQPGMREAWQVTDWRKRAAELEEEVKELREEVRTLTAGNDSLRKTRAMACRLQTLEHDAWRAFAAYMANRCKWTRKQVMRAMDALAAYDKETKRV